MHRIDGVLLLSPSDLVGFLACVHLTQLELAASRGELVRPDRVDPQRELLARKGEAHEALQLERLAAEHGGHVEIGDHPESIAGLRDAEAETLAAMQAGARIIYQAAFFDGRWRGRADFLRRIDEPSDLGSWSYEVADAKLARSVKVDALLQMCEYSRQLTRLQGRAPERMYVILGTGLEEAHRVADYDAYHRNARDRFQAFVADGGGQPSYPDPVAHCDVCPWLPRCEQRRRDDDHLCYVAGMRRDRTRRLVEAGIGTMARLAIAPPEPVADIGDTAWQRLRRQAALQVEERSTCQPTYELIDCDQPGLGLAALPPPSPGDLFFDMEGDPFADDGSLEYLFGITEIASGAPRFRSFWGDDRPEEKAAFEALVDFIIERLRRDPALHVYHYAQYEPTALKRLMGRYATREDEVDRLLRAGVFVDLYQVVRQGILASREFYSLKRLEVFYMPSRTEEIADAVSSIVAYERYRETGDPRERANIEAYNERDCESTWRLRDWLEERREEWMQVRGRPLPRPAPRTGEPSEKLLKTSAATQALVVQLTQVAATDTVQRTPEQSATWLLAQLLDWHRREDKATWWAFYDRLNKTDDELVEDAEAIGGLYHLGEVGAVNRSVVHRYGFDGAQEHKIDVGAQPCDPRTGKSCGTVIAVDDTAGHLDLRRGPSLAGVGHPSSLIPPGPPSPAAMRDALHRVASWVGTNGVDAPGSYRAGRDLLLRLPPRVIGAEPGSALVREGEDPALAAVRLVASLDHSCLAVQGPPGAGKTYTGAQIILDQVARGRRVGVCATSHRAIGELLSAVCTAAGQRGVPVRILQKCGEEDRCTAPMVEHTTDNKDVEQALTAGKVDVVAGTQWLLARLELEGQLDLVIVDEAGQMSLANVLAVAGAGKNLILLGDPQQLSQPAKGIHPPGAAVSSLEHVLAGEQTIPPDRGVFLATTRRMHPDVCGFISTAFYEGRLHARPECERQRIDGDGRLGGTGLRLASVGHAGNRTTSPEEVVAVRSLVDTLLGTTWTDFEGQRHPVGIDDILVVAPYNLHVRRLREGLGPGVRVGTVDKYQGQEAAVTIYAMATSSAEDVPRNLEFLFSRNRLNVAVSRARAVSVIVCSPLLLQVGCRTPEQLKLVSALCRFAEMATVVEAGAPTGGHRPGAELTPRQESAT